MTPQTAKLIRFAVVSIIVLILGLSFINQPESPNSETVQKAAEEQIFINTKSLIPPSATNITDVGGKWYTFDLMGKTFLIRAWGHGLGITCIEGC